MQNRKDNKRGPAAWVFHSVLKCTDPMDIAPSLPRSALAPCLKQKQNGLLDCRVPLWVLSRHSCRSSRKYYSWKLMSGFQITNLSFSKKAWKECIRIHIRKKGKSKVYYKTSVQPCIYMHGWRHHVSCIMHPVSCIICVVSCITYRVWSLMYVAP